MVISRQLLFCSSHLNSFWLPMSHNTEVQAVSNAGIWKMMMKHWRKKVNARGQQKVLGTLLVKWCLMNLWRKCCQRLWAELRTECLFFRRELRQGWSRGKRYSWRTNCTTPPLTAHTRSWVVLGAVTSRVSRWALKPWGLAALAGLDNHIGELLDFRGATHVVKDGKGLQVLRNTAGWGGCFRV